MNKPLRFEQNKDLFNANASVLLIFIQYDTLLRHMYYCANCKRYIKFVPFLHSLFIFTLFSLIKTAHLWNSKFISRQRCFSWIFVNCVIIAPGSVQSNNTLPFIIDHWRDSTLSAHGAEKWSESYSRNSDALLDQWKR